MLFTSNELAAKEIDVMWEKVPVPSWISSPVPREPWVSVSIPQEKRPAFQRSLDVRAVLQVVNPEPKSWELEE